MQHMLKLHFRLEELTPDWYVWGQGRALEAFKCILSQQSCRRDEREGAVLSEEEEVLGLNQIDVKQV